jgi:hypothetical protein
MAKEDRASACLLVWTDIPTEDEHEFNEWYSREHLRSRVIGAPGFGAGRRLVAESGGPKYVAYYEAADSTAFTSAPYLELVARPDPLSKRFIPRFRNVIRLVGRTLGGSGGDFCGSVGVLAFDVRAAKDRARQWLARELPGELTKLPGILRARTFETDREVLGASVRVHTRPDDRAPDFAVLVEGTLPEQIDAARTRILTDAAVAGRGGEAIAYARTRLMMEVRPT